VSDPLGSVEVLLDEAGRLVERVETLPEGKPRIFGEDRKRPEVLRVVWTGNGQTPAGQVPAGVLELSFSEPMRQGSLAKARIALAGQDLSGELSQDGRWLAVAASPVAGQQMTLRVEGLEDRSGNVMQPMEVSFTVADIGQYQVLLDAASPQVLAILDEGEGLTLIFDEPVVPGPGIDLGGAITVTRAGAPVEGSTTFISPWQLAWRPSESSAWLLGGEYRLSIAGLVELGPEQKPVSSSLLPASFTHLASPGEKILVASPPPETPPRASSAFGNTTLFQGRLWVPELGLYYYRARWYDPMLGDFLERDPLGPVDSPNLYQAFGRNPINITDPRGLYEKDFHFYAVYYLARAAGFAPADARLLAWSSQYVDDYEHTQPVEPRFTTLAGFHFLAPAEPSPIADLWRPWVEANVVWDSTPRMQKVKRANQIALANLNRAMAVQGERSTKLIALGIALHSWADTYAHEGFRANSDPENARPGFGWEPGDTPFHILAGEVAQVGHSAAGHTPDWPFRDVPKAIEAARSIYEHLVSFGSTYGYAREPVKPWTPALVKRLAELFGFGLYNYSQLNEDLRAREWQLAIWLELGEWVHYEKEGFYDAVPKVATDFARLAEEQRQCVLNLEFGWGCAGY
jgi:RHS repeat-associated protein